MNRRGFTVIELIIVITIMGILLILGVVNLRGTQISARDTERKTDIATIALNLETFYQVGRDGSTIFGRYPSVTMDVSILQSGAGLRDIDPKNLIAPGATDAVSSFVLATNNVQTTAGVAPQPTISTYVYQPINHDGNLCANSEYCTKFNLYYKLEGDGLNYMVTSKNQ